MEKYCKNCGRVFDDLNFKLCPYCGGELATRYGRQPIPRKLRHKVFKRDGYRCRECGASKDETSLEIDHIVPVARGGTNDINNLQTLCRVCNRMKHTDEWIAGETDSESIEHQINIKKQEKSNLVIQLRNTFSDNKRIDLKYKIKKIEEDLEVLNNKLINARENEKKYSDFQKKVRDRELKYKQLYVSLSDKDIEDRINRTNKIGYNFKTKSQIINYLVDIQNPHYINAHKYFDSGEYLKAINELDKIISLSKSEVILGLKALCYTYMQKTDDAIKYYTKAIKINPLNTLYLNCQAELYGNLGKRKKALKIYDKSININPNNDLAWSGKGFLYKRDLDFHKSLKCYNKAIELNPNNISYWEDKAYCHMQIGENDLKFECYKKIVELDPSRQDLKEKIKNRSS